MVQLTDAFDAVVMFTWSNWHTEPRSNRYHFATRFAKMLPVYFVQPTAPTGDADFVEVIDEHDITLLHVNSDYGEDQSKRLQRYLREQGIRRPLYWVYNPCFVDFLERFPGVAHVFHATEDYLGRHEEMPQADDWLITVFLRVLRATDLTVAVTEAVADSIKTNGDYHRSMMVLRNGCDFDHWASRVNGELEPEDKVVMFQGGVNARLDYPLLMELADELSDWTFWICGDARNAPEAAWKQLLARDNVQAFGQVHPDRIAELQARATVGIIPFRQITLMNVSLPLKAFEYVASGLPVVTIPIIELGHFPDLFTNATTSAEFAREIRRLGPTRQDPNWVRKRQSAAKLASYDHRFAELSARLVALVDTLSKHPARLNILVLHGLGAASTDAEREQLEAFVRHSRHAVYYLPIPEIGSLLTSVTKADFSIYDVILVHPSLDVSAPGNAPQAVTHILRDFNGVKVLFLEHEHEHVNATHDTITSLQIDIVYTRLSEHDIEQIYPAAKLHGTRFEPVLAGYVPEASYIDLHSRDLDRREFAICHRGWPRPPHGEDGNQARNWLGSRIRILAEAEGIPVNPETNTGKELRGEGWYDVLGNSRGMLHLETGSRDFDEDYSLAVRAPNDVDVPYAEFQQSSVTTSERPTRSDQISPTILEAVRLRVALVLLEGSYLGILSPDAHYIPLKRDLSNLREVFDKLDDVELLERITALAHEKLVASGRYSYASLISRVDTHIDQVNRRRAARAEIVSAPFMVKHGHDLRRISVNDLLHATTSIVPNEEFVRTAEAITGLPGHPEPGEAHSEQSRLSRLAAMLQSAKIPKALRRLARATWRRTPPSVRATVARLIG